MIHETFAHSEERNISALARTQGVESGCRDEVQRRLALHGLSLLSYLKKRPISFGCVRWIKERRGGLQGTRGVRRRCEGTTMEGPITVGLETPRAGRGS